MDDKKYALLIDADNISAKYISGILDELAKYGVSTYKRIYGDWTSTQASKWKEELLTNSIVPIQQFSNTVGKNATDSTCRLETSETEDVDWVNSWKKYFHQFTIDDILITPSWEKPQASDSDKMIIHIDPGTAFGTGKHG